MEFHCYVDRKVRNKETFENDTIITPVIICLEAKRENKPYTKRLLPDFVTPLCNIRLDNTLEAFEKGVTTDEACLILGCLDIRTARRHLKSISIAINNASLSLAEKIASTPQLAELPEPKPDSTPVMILESLVNQLNQRYIHLGIITILFTVTEMIQPFWPSPIFKKSSHPAYLERPPPDKMGKSGGKM